MTLNPDQPHNETQLPEELLGALRQTYGQATAVPAELDQRILREARTTYARRRRQWLVVRWCGAGLAAAAAVALAVRVFISHPAAFHPAVNAPRQVAQLGDIDRNGRVDIVDAYAVARKIARHEPLDPAWDVNGDGVVDQKDVDLIAHMAVRVSPEAAQ